MTNLQQQAPDKATHRHYLPGDTHIWVMVLGDLVIFGAYFLIFMVYRAMNAHQYLQSQQHLNVTLGVVNTIALLTSSWFVARGVQAARGGDPDRAVKLTYWGGAFGVAFIVIKAYEWFTKIGHGYTITTDQFFTFYYMLTGVHLFHVALGLLILGVVVRELRNPRKRRAALIESGGIYWHMVDLLWVVIFALFYVMR
jgi:nitric oxide reductase NorE protein